MRFGELLVTQCRAFALFVLSFVLIALLALFLARLKWPDLASEQINAVLSWGGGG